MAELNTVGDTENEDKKSLQIFTVEELRKYDGTNDKKLIYIALVGDVFDVTSGEKFYGQGAPYCMFAGRDATKGLGTFKLKNLDDDDWSDLSEKHMENAQRWHSQFKVKYPIIGTLKRDFKKKTLNNNDELKSEEKIQESKKNTANRGGRPATPMPKKESRFCLIL
ncbi:DgyrCDS12936 [Dimorphilus gyrociliatus]|uniref:DgyrCDS12936 n=1 Tax=Dimorphilus gyrociliatus TaxID=2664684 RepID=A0A7I8W978_9ANNE|nr:DgyrCDS12936 [Dimorphilus gyrociliatus]